MKKIILLLVALFLLAGCSSRKDAYANSTAGASYDMEGAYLAEDTYYQEDSKEDSAYVYNYVDESSYDADTNSFSGNKIIYSANMDFETKSYDSAKANLETILKNFQVIIDNKSERDYDNYWYTTSYHTDGVKGRIMTLHARVSVDQFDNLLNALSGLESVHVTSSNVYANDVTKQYNENAVLIEEYEVEQKRLTELLSQAQNVSEILEIEDRLTVIRANLKQLTNTNSELDYDVKYSPIYLSLKEVEKYSVEKYGFGERMKDTFGESWVNFADFIKDIILFIIAIFPFALFIFIIIFAINFIRVKKGKDKLSIRKIKFNWKIILCALGAILLILLILALLINLF